jgi:hypothetical protein
VADTDARIAIVGEFRTTETDGIRGLRNQRGN